VLPLDGRRLDVDEAVEAVTDGWLVQDPVRLPVDLERVRTSEQDVRSAVTDLAAPAVAAPVVLDAGGDELVVPPEALAAALRVEADDEGELVPRLAPDVLRAQLAAPLRRSGNPPETRPSTSRAARPSSSRAAPAARCRPRTWRRRSAACSPSRSPAGRPSP
jgi:hypothetical protein